MSDMISADSLSNALEILIVDDDELLCQRIEMLLAAHGLSAISVNSLDLAREAMRAVYFPLVILDRHLGDGDGADLCREYRARQSDKRVRILMLSSSDSAEESAFALACGADEFLSKKCGDGELAARVTHLHAIACDRRPSKAAYDPEASRLRALYDFDVLDTIAEQAYDDLTRLASAICKTPISLISLIDSNRQWFKSKVGLNATDTPREHAICSHAIQTPHELFIVNDARADARFADFPAVTGEPNVRFYAGAPLVTSGGHAIGTVCVIDTVPRTLDAEARECLRALARQVVLLLEQRQQRRDLERTLVANRAADADLRRSSALFREAFESAPIGKALVSMNGDWLRVNRALCDIVGYTEKELLATSFQAITHPEDLKTDLGFVREMIGGLIRSYEMEKRYVHKRGHFVWVLLSVSLVRDELDRPMYFISQIQDISERKQLEQAKTAFSGVYRMP